jgi:endo-1,4-beta-xylanase
MKWALIYPASKDVEAFLSAMVAVGVRGMIAEMDIDILPKTVQHKGADLGVGADLRRELDPYVASLPDEMYRKLANRYAELFSILRKYTDKISRVTFSGIYGKTSRLNNWPVSGRTNYPLLSDREYQPKPAFFAVVKTAQSKELPEI